MLQTLDVGLWNVVPDPNLVQSNSTSSSSSSAENVFATRQITASDNPPFVSNVLRWCPGAGLAHSPPSSCLTTEDCYLSGSPIKRCPSVNHLQEKSHTAMNSSSGNSAPTHVVEDDPDAISPPASANNSNNWWTTMLMPPGNHSHQASPSASPMTDLEALNWSSDLATTAASCDLVERLSNSMAIQTTSSSITADGHQHLGACSGTLVDPSLSMGSGLPDGSVWSQVLLGGTSSEAMQTLQNCSIEGLQDLLYSRTLRQGGEFLLSDHPPTWDLALKSFTFQGDEMQCTPTLQYPQIVDDRLSSTTCSISEMETWHAAQDHSNAASQSASMSPFTSGLEVPSVQFDQSRVKQEYPSYGCTTPNSSPFWLQGFGVDAYRGDVGPSQLMDGGNRPLLKTVAAGVSPSFGEEFPVRWPSAHPSRFPATFPQTLSSAGLGSRQHPQMFAFGNSFSRHPLDLPSFRADMRQSMHGIATDRTSPLQYVQQSTDGKQLHDTSNLRTIGHVEEPTSDSKRNVGNCDGSSDGLFKRPRVEPAPPTLPFKQVRKEKLGDRITALQQLVSPFGKTDTASVLLEAIGYIKFLQEQVQVLSTPYMKSTSTTTTQNDPGKKNWSSDKGQADTDEPKQDLRSRGLCLVPVSCTSQVANDNGADYWAPSLGGSSYR